MGLKETGADDHPLDFRAVLLQQLKCVESDRGPGHSELT
jgi:hypothetical protein